MNITIDQEFQNLIPKLTEDETEQLEYNILQYGCREPIILWNNIIIDGHNRYSICQKHNIEYKTISMEFENRNDVIEFIIENQFGRRNLSIGQRALIAMKLVPIYAQKAKDNLRTSTGGKSPQPLDMLPKAEDKINTRDILAGKADVSSKTMGKVQIIVKHGTPEDIERVNQGGKGNSVNAVYNEVKQKITLQKRNDIQPKKRKRGVFRDSFGDEYKTDPEIAKRCKELQPMITASLFRKEHIEFTIDDLVKQLKNDAECYHINTGDTLDQYKHLINSKDNILKIKTIFDGTKKLIDQYEEKYFIYD